MKINPDTARNIRISVIYLSLSSGLIFLILRFGLGTAVKVSEFLQKNNSGGNETLLDNFISEPKFSIIPEATNSAQLVINGYAPANKEVLLKLNDVDEKSFSTDSEGKFTGEITLNLGMNTFYAVTKDFNGKTSPNSETKSVFFSDSPPNLEITEPTAGSVINNNPDITITGKTGENSKLYANDHLVTISSDGTFSYSIKLNKGDNLFKFSAIDPAQNKSEVEVTYQFRP